MALDENDYKMLNCEFELIQTKLDLSNEHLSQIQKTLYQLLLEAAKHTALLEVIALKGRN